MCVEQWLFLYFWDQNGEFFGGKETYSVLSFLFISFTQIFQGSLISSIAFEKKNSQKSTELIVQVFSLELSELIT